MVLVGEIEGGPGFDSFLYSYKSAGLKVHAMVAVPHAPQPENGFPVLVANHGHHPDPPEYGITAEGKDWRPGDYYRRIPELFVAQGFMVVMPDFRGHNNSEGFEFTEGMLESSYYTEDVLNLLAGLESLDGRAGPGQKHNDPAPLAPRSRPLRTRHAQVAPKTPFSARPQRAHANLAALMRLHMELVGPGEACPLVAHEGRPPVPFLRFKAAGEDRGVFKGHTCAHAVEGRHGMGGITQQGDPSGDPAVERLAA